MDYQFEWGEEKAELNILNHGISFNEAKTVFGDPNALTIADPIHSFDEDRYIDIGFSLTGRLLVVSYTERGDNIRLISCRKATSNERKIYGKR